MNRLVAIAMFALVHIARTPSARANEPAHVAYALVVGNNRSLGGHRPDLHYADDDGAKYFELLRTMTGDDQARLLTSFDRDSARLFPSLVARAAPPDRAHVLAAGSEIAAAADKALKAGTEVDFYFVFAGHGDVEQGRGIIELSDSAFSSDDLERLLRSVPATRKHVILDSCNSFFMIDARKPGGRHFATSEDAARTLHDRLPDVGVFLSTSAEGEVFEWSELQSGIFSHVVRSGLMGAADANADGMVSYAELNAFAATAVADIKNPNYRPHTFSRGPNGRADAVLVDLRRSEARRIDVAHPTGLRLTLRNGDGIPLLDLHNEAGRRVALYLPPEWANGGSIDQKQEGELAFRSVALGAGTADMSSALASLPPTAATIAERGARDLFAALYARPFGPRAFAAFALQAAHDPPKVYGVSREDAARMDLLVDAIGDAERASRVATGATMLLLSGSFVLDGMYTWNTVVQPDDPTRTRRALDVSGTAYVGIAALFAGYGAYTLASPWAGERVRNEYQAGLRRSPGDYASAFANTETRVRELAEGERRAGRYTTTYASVAIALSAAMLVTGELSDRTPQQRNLDRLTWGTTGLFSGILLLNGLMSRSPVEKLADVWTREPSFRKFPQLSIAPMKNGALLSVAGQF